MCSINLEVAELWDERERTARTPKQCDACCARIVPGRRYVKHFSKHDGDITSEVICKPCEKDRAEFADAHGGMTPGPSFFVDLLIECVDDTEDDRWAEMLRGLRARKEQA